MFRLMFALWVVPFVLYGGWGAYERHRLDARLREYRAAGEAVAPEDFAGTPVPPDENAAEDLLAFGRVIERHDDVWNKFDQTYFDLPWRADEEKLVGAAVREYAEWLGQIERATRKPSVRWRIDYGRPWSKQLLPRYEGPRGAAILLLGDALYAHQVEGDERRALLRVGQELRLAEIIDRQQLLVPHLTALGFAEVASTIVEEIVPDLRVGPGGGGVGADEVRAAIEDLLDERVSRDGMVRALMGERLAMVNGFTEIDMEGESMALRRLGPFAMKPFASRAAEALARRDTAVLRGFARADSWPAYRRAVDLAPLIEEARGTLAEGFGEGTGRAVRRHFSVSAERRMAAAALALRWHAADYDGGLPETLGELVPAYLPAVPADPFAPDGAPLRYQREGGEAVLYSVGWDGKDDGGSEALRPEVEGGDPRADRWICVDAVFHLERRPRMDQRPTFFGRGIRVAKKDPGHDGK
jgi:hypothetical protein